ncbi:immunoglobulin-binding protein 1 [Eupeodes corollae]|uniref:immunoglobulin-binding protein 1 n=1 Tax=Eupeodes corollae TaxID=290404 RepID=UPI0024908A7D|nr:immunoglobulin-binding protein 1 [Eupeodes corollae]
MAESTNSEDKKLHEIFLNGWDLYEELEKTTLPFSSEKYQRKVKDSIGSFEESTKIVNHIAMFSPNELIDEVPTEHLQYLLLPFFLAKLSTKLVDSDRGRLLDLAEIYYNDFLQRCSEYELTEAPKKVEGNGTVAESNGNNRQDELASLMRAAHSRNDKIAQFRKKKELDEQIKLLHHAVRNESIDDEVKRDFFIKFINRSIIESNEELDSLKLEKQMVQMRASQISSEPSKKTKVKAPPRPPMKPFIITRDNTQKAVFGMGYPSLPVMTVGEFYHQRVHEGIFPNEEQVQEMNKQQHLARTANPEEKEDEEKAVNEVLEENDDEEYLQRQRGMDEYKDVVRRGDGNRHNRS